MSLEKVRIRLSSQAMGSICYITYDMDFGFVPSDTVCFDKLSRFE